MPMMLRLMHGCVSITPAAFLHVRIQVCVVLCGCAVCRWIGDDDVMGWVGVALLSHSALISVLEAGLRVDGQAPLDPGCLFPKLWIPPGIPPP